MCLKHSCNCKTPQKHLLLLFSYLNADKLGPSHEYKDKELKEAREILSQILNEVFSPMKGWICARNYDNYILRYTL